MPRKATTSTVTLPSTRGPSSVHSWSHQSPASPINDINGTISHRHPDSPRISRSPREPGRTLVFSGPVTRRRRRRLDEAARNDAQIEHVLGGNQGADAYLVGIGSFGRPPFESDVALTPRPMPQPSTPENSEDSLGVELNDMEREMRQRRRRRLAQHREHRDNRTARPRPVAQHPSQPNGADRQQPGERQHPPLPTRRRGRSFNTPDSQQ